MHPSQEAGTFCKGNTRPELSWREARPRWTFFWASRTQAAGHAALLAGPARGHPVGQPATPKEAHLRYLPEQMEARGRTKPVPAYSSETAGRSGGWISADSQKVSPTRGEGTVTTGSDPALPGVGGPNLQRGSPRGSRRAAPAHSPRGRSCPLFRALHYLRESGFQLAEVSPAEGPGKPCESWCDSQELKPAGLPRCHRLTAFSSFAPFVCPNPSL